MPKGKYQILFAYPKIYVKMRFIQKPLHRLRDRAWRLKKALIHMDRAIIEMELVRFYASYPYETLKFSLDELKVYRRQEYFEYKNTISILKNYTLFENRVRNIMQ